MKLRQVKIKNFRCLVDIDVPITDTVILVGENNSGKTAFLDAIKIAIRSLTSRGNPFTEYDYCMMKTGDAPETCGGIEIELWFTEDSSGEWPDTLLQALTDITQLDPILDLNAIGVRVSSKYDIQQKLFENKIEFLNILGQPAGGKAQSFINNQRFSSYIRLFYLPSIRNPEDEFTQRSQFWGRIVHDLKISDAKRASIMRRLEKINHELLTEDPRLDNVVEKLDEVQKLMSSSSGHSTSIQALPMTPWDLMSKAELVIKPRGNQVDFPLSKHGQGVQSLAVIFLFQAFVDVLLKPTFEQETEAILEMEEPEAHLHPQATRSLAANLKQITSQKIISTHSPYFIQEVPLTDIRLFRRRGASTKVLYLKRYYSIPLPRTDDLIQFCQRRSPKYVYDETRQSILLSGKMDEQEKRALMMLFPHQDEIYANINKLNVESKLYISDAELAELETYIKRIRGEIFFARTWLFCEGQSEYIVLRYFSELLNCPLDRSGVAIVDFQNNGSIDVFIRCAISLDVPWFMVSDGDDAGNTYSEKARSYCSSSQEKKKRVLQLPQNCDFEKYLFKNGFCNDYLEIIGNEVKELAPRSNRWTLAEKTNNSGEKVSLVLQNGRGYEIQVQPQNQRASIVAPNDQNYQLFLEDLVVTKIQTHKPFYANLLVRHLITTRADSARVPHLFKVLIESSVKASL